MKELNDHLTAVFAQPNASSAHYCFFGIHTPVILTKKDIDLVALAHSCHLQAARHPLLRHQTHKEQISKEHRKFRYTLFLSPDSTGRDNAWEKSLKHVFYQERFELHQQYFAKHSSKPCLFFGLCFQPVFTDALVIVLAHTFHLELSKRLHSLPADTSLQAFRQTRQYAELEGELTALFNSIEAYSNYDAEEIYHIQNLFWNQCADLLKQYGVHQEPDQAFDPEMFSLVRVVIAIGVLLIIIAALLCYYYFS